MSNKHFVFSICLVVFACFSLIVDSKDCNYVADDTNIFAPGYCTGFSNNTYALSYKFVCDPSGTFATGYTYSTGNCSGDYSAMGILNTQNQLFQNRNFTFYCAGVDCGGQLKESLYISNDCSGTPEAHSVIGLLFNYCKNKTELTCTSSLYGVNYCYNDNCDGPKRLEASISTGCTIDKSSANKSSEISIICPSGSQKQSISFGLLLILSVTIVFHFN